MHSDATEGQFHSNRLAMTVFGPAVPAATGMAASGVVSVASMTVDRTAASGR